MADADDFELADRLVVEWHEWASRWRPALGAPRVGAGMRNAVTSRQYESQPMAEDVLQAEMEAVEWCIDALDLARRAAIAHEMVSRSHPYRVWRNNALVTYAMALEQLVPLMRRRLLL
jgi:hypothetical protein